MGVYNFLVERRNASTEILRGIDALLEQRYDALKAQAQAKLPGALASGEAYASSGYAQNVEMMQRTINELEERLGAARRHYNTAATDYNTARQSFPHAARRAPARRAPARRRPPRSLRGEHPRQAGGLRPGRVPRVSRAPRPTPHRVSVPPFEQLWPGIAPHAEKAAQDAKRLTGWGGSGCWYGLLILAATGLSLLGHELLDLLGGLLGLVGIVGFGWSFITSVAGLWGVKADHQRGVVGPLVDALVQQTHARDVVGGEPVTLQAGYDPRGSIDPWLIAASGIVREPDLFGEDLVHGRFGRTDLAFCDLSWLLPGRSSEAGRTFAKVLQNLPTGAILVFFTADFHKDFTSETYLFSRSTSKVQASSSGGAGALRRILPEEAAGQGLTPLELEGVRFGELFTGWTTDQLEARYLISPQTLEAILTFAEHCGAVEYALSFTGGRPRSSTTTSSSSSRWSSTSTSTPGSGPSTERVGYPVSMSSATLLLRSPR
ncbi:Uncharacterized conserved protein [Kytococcus aerolatus]|uniref:Uncharacterized conserved protein n=1 Tax=Kytococcus aerolatus TaxID=592308 RepID=A0A212T5I6_9MICO|nr:DUF3137 domain-containing protein [Kytococcus aerolatus]SNC61279.1 Uncharacterized conserved protein [Kytococcus aerolatus]